MYLYGASGHGKVIKEIIESQNQTIEGFIDDNINIYELAGLPVKHSTQDADEVIVSIGVNVTRKKVVEKLHCSFSPAAIHRQAIVSKTAEVGTGTVVMAGAIVNADAKIGKHCIINTGASIDHVVKVGIFVHSAPHCTLCGGAEVGEGTRIGAGSTLIQGIHIGRDYNIEAGSVVVNDIPDGVLSFGSPARIIKYNNNYADKRAHSINLFGGEMGVCEAAYNKYAA